MSHLEKRQKMVSFMNKRTINAKLKEIPMKRKKSTTKIEDQTPEEREEQQRLNLTCLAMLKKRLLKLGYNPVDQKIRTKNKKDLKR